MGERPDRLRQLITTARADKRLDWFLDLDGTLVEIALRPEAIVFPRDLCGILRALHRPPLSFVSIVSGRSLPQLQSLFHREAIILAGNHGLEVAGQGISFVHPGAEKASCHLESLADDLRRALAGVPGLILENKQFTLTVHYRLVPVPERGKVARTVEKAAAFHPFLVHRAKESLEIIPRLDWGKGDAVRLILEHTRGPRWEETTVPVCIGDDRTDEDAFGFLRRAGRGVTVRVGPRRADTKAEFRLENPADVREFLRSFVPS